MAPIILSARLRGDLEDLVLRTPSAKQRCRARRCSGSPRALSAEQVAETFQVSRQTVYNWVNRFLRRDDLELRARLLDAPRPGRPPSIAEVIDPLIAAAFAGDPRESGYHATVWDRRVAAAPLGARSWDQGLRQEHQRGDRTPGSPLETAPA